MPDCDGIAMAIEKATERLQEAQKAVNDATQNASMAMTAYAAAQAATLACGLTIAGGLLAFGACELAALAALAAAGYAVDYYEKEAEKAAEAYGQLEAIIEKLNQDYAHCAGLQSWQEEAAQELLAEAEALAEEADNVQIEEVDDGPLDDAESALAEAEGAVNEAEAIASAAGGSNDFPNV